MRAVVQRVLKSSVSVDGVITGAIEKGFTVLLGVEEGDTKEDADYLGEKIVGLRVFDDEDGKMNLSLSDVGGALLVISQFTLLGDCRKGKRPSFIKAARPEIAKELYEYFVVFCKNRGIFVQEGVFQAEMVVSIENDGPVTLLLDSRKNY